MPGPIQYKSNKTIPWNYGGEIFYHGVKQIESAEENSDEEIPDVGNIAGTSKITRSGRIFSPEISPPRAVFGPSSAPMPVKIYVRSSVIEEIDTPEVVPVADKGKGI